MDYEPLTTLQTPLADLIKSQALSLGFSLCGITSAAPPPHLEVYQDWVANGLHAEMGYMASERNMERRADVQKILPGCKSVIVLATNYYQGAVPSVDPTQQGQVGRYAWNLDYHDVIKQRLLTLVAFIEERVGHPVQQRVYVDTGPILEGEFAQRAGLGWLGKHSLLISPQIGSWVLLSEILLDLELPQDAPLETDHCGTCTRCIDACPTDAILTGRRLVDANKCISYQTIEQKTSIPSDIRHQFGNWVFGCDICQDVCPWNVRFAPVTQDVAFLPRPTLPNPQLRDLLTMSQHEFSATYKDSPIKRTKRRGMGRNAAIALGNAPSEEGLAALSKALSTHDEPLVRGHAAWAIGQHQAYLQQARDVLIDALSTETDTFVLEEIKTALANLA